MTGLPTNNVSRLYSISDNATYIGLKFFKKNIKYVTFPASEHGGPLAGKKIILLLATEAHWCERLSYRVVRLLDSVLTRGD